MIKILAKKIPTKTDTKQLRKVINEWNSIIVSTYTIPKIKIVSANDSITKKIYLSNS